MDKFLYFSKEDIANAQQPPCVDIQGFRNKLYNDFYEELEATVCSVMAAGVSVSEIRLSTPKLDNKDYVFTLNCHMMFRGIHFN
jgi:hypothetical protein